MVTRNTETQKGGLHTAAELAKILSVTSKTIHNWADEGIIPVAVRSLKTVRFNLDDVMQALNEVTGRTQRAKQSRGQARRSGQQVLESAV
jgi:hypothetical protein